MEIYMKKDKIGVNATGTYNPDTKECIVLKGSKVSDTISNAPTFRGAKSVKMKRNRTLRGNVVAENVAFKSCSTAGNYVTGRSTDGFAAWRVADGRTLRDYLSSK